MRPNHSAALLGGVHSARRGPHPPHCLPLLAKPHLIGQASPLCPRAPPEAKAPVHKTEAISRVLTGEEAFA